MFTVFVFRRFGLKERFLCDICLRKRGNRDEVVLIERSIFMLASSLFFSEEKWDLLNDKGGGCFLREFFF